MDKTKRVAVVNDDNLIIYGDMLHVLDFEKDETISAIQWRYENGVGKGEIEYKDKANLNTFFGEDEYESVLGYYLGVING